MACPREPIKIAIIGMGHIGPRHATTVLETASTVLSAIVDPMPASVELAKQFKAAHYSSVKDLLESSDRPDGAIVCTPNHLHVPISLDLAAAGIHILVEKPVSTDSESGQLLIQVAKAAGVKLLVGHHRRFSPHVMAAKKTIESGSLGDIIAISGLWTTYKPPSYFEAPTAWRQTSTGGVIFINMIHEVDILHELLGPITRVFAEKTKSKRGYEAEEGAAVTLRFASGVVGTFLISDHTPSPHGFEAGTGENPLIPKTGQDFYRIFGTNGMLSVPDMTSWGYAEDNVKSWHSALTEMRHEVSQGTAFMLQLAHFVEVIEGREEPSCSGESGLAALEVCEALKKSMLRGMPVEIGGVS